MIRPGFMIENPRTRSRTRVIESDAETNGAGWLLEVTCVPGTEPDIAEHLHLTWTETFEIVSGTAHYSLDGAQKTLQAGESFTALPKQRHIHPWNAGETLMVYRQRDTFASPTPAAVQEVLGVFATIAALAREGKVDKKGYPKNPLQLAATLRVLSRHGGYDTSLPIGIQKFLAATLGRLAERRGYRAVDPQVVKG
ncbi:MAG TPA: cupin domain-containing protein [Herpetosiphonaceae bacterium]|nr:cupin domain-containing protein [Herpetosiphonaceae bacterium]